MSDTRNLEMQAKDKVLILLKEYDTLRAEIIGRINNYYQLMAIGAAILTFLLSRNFDAKFCLLLLVFVGLFSFLGWLIHRDMGLLAARLIQLEAHINTLAGDDLLQWETRWGGAATGSIFRKRPLQTQDNPKNG